MSALGPALLAGGLLAAGILSGARAPVRRRVIGVRPVPVHGQGGGQRGGQGRSQKTPSAAPVPEPLVLELVAAILDAGSPVEHAIEAVAGALDGAGDRGEDLRAGEAGCAATLRELVALSSSTGLPLAGLVRAAAADRRRALGAAQAKAAHRLAVLLVLPTGLCLLPAFILLGVVPLILDLIVGS